MDLRSKIREVQDWPKKGINFKDITTLLQNKEAFRCMVDQMTDFYRDNNIDKVVGIDAEGFIYILDLFQFRTSKYAAMADKLFELQRKWGFHKCKLETNAGASMIVEHIRSEIRREGIPLVIEGKQSRVDKDERYAAIMGTRYANSGVFHPKGGFINEYEQQVTMARPRHDDLRDAVCAAVEICKAPNKQRRTGVIKREGNVISARFGGRRA